MSSFKYLGKNIGLLVLSQFGTKILIFLLIPLYTSILTTEEYGIYDILSSAVSLLIPVLTLNISESALRFALDSEKDKTQIFTIAVKHIAIGSVIISTLIFVNHLFKISVLVDTYWCFVLLMFLTNSINSVVTGFARGIDRVKDVAISGILSTISMLTLNILFLVPLKMGLSGYFIAYISSTCIQALYLFCRCSCWKYLTRKTHKIVELEMLRYSKPLIANSVAWWITNLSDRYVITLMCGLVTNGIYSVAGKIPSILNLFQQVFNQAWTLSAVKDFDAEDKDGFFSQLYNFYHFGMVAVCSLLIIVARLLAYLLYAKDFFAAWRYVPFLLIAIVFGSLSGYVGGIFSAVKDSKIYARSTVAGAVINFVLNIILVYFYGAIGAAVATMVAYWIVLILRIYHVRKYINIKFNLVRDHVSYFVLLSQAVVLLFFDKESIGLYVLLTGLFVVIIILFKKETTQIFSKLGEIWSKRACYRNKS